MNTEPRLGFNDVLIGHTTICEASRLLSHTQPEHSLYSPPRPVLRLLELCALTETVVLHDKLFTLPAELPSDVSSLQLRKRLLETGVLEEYSSPILFKEVIDTLVTWISKSSIGSIRYKPDTQLILTILTKMLDRKSEFLHLLPSASNAENINDIYYLEVEKIAELIEKLENGCISGEMNVLGSLGKQVGKAIPIAGSGLYHATLPTLRSIMYWQVAEKTSMPWYPDVLRVPMMLALDSYLKSSISDKVYIKVAQAFGTTVEELCEEEIAYEVNIPPLGALLLSRCSKNDDVVDQMLALRDEFANFRKRFRELELERINAKYKNLKAVRAARLERDRLLKAVATKYKQQDTSIIETSIRSVPGAISLLTNPLDPSKYSADLLIKSYEWIRDWWYRRPVSRLFSVTKKLETLEEYGQLIPRLFGFELTADDANFIRAYNSKMRTFIAPVVPSNKYEP